MSERMLIGVITADCYVEFQRDIMGGVIEQAFRSSCDVVAISAVNNFFNYDESSFAEASIFDMILSDRFSGFIYNRNSFGGDEIRRHIDELCIRSGKPVVLLDQKFHEEFDTISADDSAPFEEIVDHLINVHGCRRIYCLTGPKDVDISEEHLNGYFISMKKHKLKYDKSCYFYGDFWKQAPVRLAEHILRGELEKPDAVVCGNDVMAISLTERLISGGMRVPEDIAVTGFDASIDSYRINPTITGYHRPNHRLGSEAVRKLCRIITGRVTPKIIGEEGSLRIGRSCGCIEEIRPLHGTQRRIKMDEDLSAKLYSGDMLVSLTNADTLDGLIDAVDNYTYLIYRMNRFFICLTDSFVSALASDSTRRLTFSVDEPMQISYSKSITDRSYGSERFPDTCAVLDKLLSDRKHPAAYYILPLCCNGNCFGYSAVSFGKSPITYSELYTQWIKYLNVALQGVLNRSRDRVRMERLEASSARDVLTGLLGLSGFFSACERKLGELGSDSDVTYIHIELPKLKNSYYRCGGETVSKALRNFADILQSALKSGELCGAVAAGCFGVLTALPNRTEELFGDIRLRLETCVIEHGSDFGTAFTLGMFTGKQCDFGELGELIHNAAVNRVHSYSHEDTGVNPQFERICRLRIDIMQHPEYEWSISEIASKLYLSKSYLQKMYKYYFKCSIIEELIYFRIEKAKKLLAETDMTVTDIARECGYSTYNYFVRRFKSSENMSPSEYREAHRS